MKVNGKTDGSVHGKSVVKRIKKHPFALLSLKAEDLHSSPAQ